MRIAKAIALLLLLIAPLARTASAQITHFDTLNANIIILPLNVDNPTNALGAPDNRQAHLRLNSEFDLGFASGGQLITFNPGTTLRLHWNKESSDSVGGVLRFVSYLPNVDKLIERTRSVDSIILTQQGIVNITVPTPPSGFDYNAIKLTLTGGTDLGGSTSFYVDAVTLIQPGFLSVPQPTEQRFASSAFPNPFVSTSGTTLQFMTPRSGVTEIYLYDLMGREVSRLNLGALSAGEQKAKITLDHTGVFLARISVDGSVVGEPIKITAE